MSLYKTLKRPFGLTYYYIKDEVLPVWRQTLQRKERDLGATAAVLLGGAFKPVIMRLGKQLAERALDPDGPSFADGLRRARERTRSDGASGPNRAGGSGA